MGIIVDTCQAQTLFDKIYSPNVIAISSSKKGEDSLSHHADRETGVYVIDRYTYYLLEFLEKMQKTKNKNKTVRDLYKICPKSQCISTSNHREFDLERSVDDILVTDFFSGVRVLEKIDEDDANSEENTDSYEM